MSQPQVSLSRCPARWHLFEEFKDWSRILNEIHELQVQALLLTDDLGTFQSLQAKADKAREWRNKIFESLQSHIQEHGC